MLKKYLEWARLTLESRWWMRLGSYMCITLWNKKSGFLWAHEDGKKLNSWGIGSFCSEMANVFSSGCTEGHVLSECIFAVGGTIPK